MCQKNELNNIFRVDYLRTLFWQDHKNTSMMIFVKTRRNETKIKLELDGMKLDVFLTICVKKPSLRLLFNALSTCQIKLKTTVFFLIS